MSGLNPAPSAHTRPHLQLKICSFAYPTMVNVVIQLRSKEKVLAFLSGVGVMYFFSIAPGYLFRDSLAFSMGVSEFLFLCFLIDYIFSDIFEQTCTGCGEKYHDESDEEDPMGCGTSPIEN